MAHTCNPSIQDAQTGKLQQIPSQDGLHSETLPQQQKLSFKQPTQKDELQYQSLPGWKAKAQRVKWLAQNLWLDKACYTQAL